MDSRARLILRSTGLNWPGQGSLTIALGAFQEKSRRISEILAVFLRINGLGSVVSALDGGKLNEGALNPRRHAVAVQRDEQRRAQLTCGRKQPNGRARPLRGPSRLLGRRLGGRPRIIILEVAYQGVQVARSDLVGAKRRHLSLLLFVQKTILIR